MIATSRVTGGFRIALGLTVVVAGVIKAHDPLPFMGALFDYALPLPEPVLRGVAVWLPWFEVLLGIALIVDKWRETIRPVTVVLFAVFVAVLSQAVIRGLEIRCGCFGATGSWFETPAVAILRAILCLCLALYLVVDDNRRSN